MAKKILLAGVLGGVVMFIWGAVSHMLLPLGEIGIKEIPNEQPVLEAMQKVIHEPGFYFFPGLGMPHNTADEAATKAWEEKYRRGPVGVLVYQPQGAEVMSPGQLLTELASNILAMLIAAYLLVQAAGNLASFGARVMFVGLLGLLASAAILISYWNWYGFPTDFMLAGALDEVLGFSLAGTVLAAIIKPEHA